MLNAIRNFRDNLRLPARARLARSQDRQGVPDFDPGIDLFVDECARWLGRAQDHSRTEDGGVARHFGLIDGWSASYPETTGYIVPTMLDCSSRLGVDQYRVRARRMLDWLASIQLSGGGFQGGMVDATPVVPVTFNTGQIVLGLCAGLKEFGDYEESLVAACDWLVNSQDPDGCWRKHPTPFAAPGEKVYETHVSWGLFEAERLRPGRGYGDAGIKQVEWALTKQRDDGWFDECCLNDPDRPLTHTIGYALRGIVEAYLLTRDSRFLDAAVRCSDGLLQVVEPDGELPGRLSPGWLAGTSWSCLTGNVQIAHSWLLLDQVTGVAKYRDAAYDANRFVRRVTAMDGRPEIRGGVKGAFPVDGAYGAFQYLNWAAKFAIDSNFMEFDVRQAEASSHGSMSRT